MNNVMLARNPNLYSYKRLVEAANEHGHQLDIINPLRWYMNIATRRPTVNHNGEKLPDYDTVMPRIGASVTFYGSAVLPVRSSSSSRRTRNPAKRKRADAVNGKT